MDDKLDFNFGTTGSIFGDFTPDLSSLQPKAKEEEPVIKEKEVETPDPDENQDIDEPVDNTPVDTDDPDDNQIQDEPEEFINNISYNAIVDHLAQSGILDSLEGYEGEDSAEVLELAVDNTIKNMVQHYKDSIPETGKQFLDYLERGGDPSKFYQSLEKPIDFNNLDLTNEDTQKKVYTEYLRSLDYTPEEIAEELQDAEDNLLLEKKAKTASTKLEKVYKNKQQDLIAQQEQEIKNQQKQYESYINEVNTTIESSNELAGLSLTPSEKAEFKKYLLNTDSEGLTKYQRELNENPVKTQLELAYLKFKKYDFSKVSRQAITKETKRIANLVRQTDKTGGRSPQVNNKTAGDLSAFRGL